MPEPNLTPPTDVPSAVFTAFLENLKAAGAGKDLTEPLQNALLDERSFTEKSLREAIFGGGIPE